ncbi:hypothetical protein [Desulfoferrobacter suflitae]|uniref:hypothetical protein n=1 Tax=Desulfoferrobacter suflitae TaxID=2865782 RepID=UPI0021642158|nr:hypothetical protein [Desulfoferrobacter suflitae]MCK8603712.1 hypothetical protein [Desulfoferrobacter suflitae]
MDFEQIKTTAVNWSPVHQKGLIMEVLPAIWPQIGRDEECFEKLKELLDEAAVKEYVEQHMGGI